MEGSGGGKPFILVHGLCHGAWCWYKLVPMLRAAGHRVTALDMAASGADGRGGVLRGLLAAAARRGRRGTGRREAGPGRAQPRRARHRARHGDVPAQGRRGRVPRRVGRHMGATTEEIMRRIKPDFFMDMKRMVLNTSQGPRPALVFGPKLLAAKLYDRSSAEDQTLATILVRPGCRFLDDPTMKDEALLTAANYGLVKKVYVVAMADASNSEAMQST